MGVSHRFVLNAFPFSESISSAKQPTILSASFSTSLKLAVISMVPMWTFCVMLLLVKAVRESMDETLAGKWKGGGCGKDFFLFSSTARSFRLLSSLRASSLMYRKKVALSLGFASGNLLFGCFLCEETAPAIAELPPAFSTTPCAFHSSCRDSNVCGWRWASPMWTLPHGSCRRNRHTGGGPISSFSPSPPAPPADTLLGNWRLRLLANSWGDPGSPLPAPV
mmetsp:Transcript_3095/g.6329  ORF Transcript_3095/g.6329 Transcript_3095/m.6329 type:complete len:222 (-) Transcript_3095:1294-1959(-)